MKFDPSSPAVLNQSKKTKKKNKENKANKDYSRLWQAVLDETDLGHGVGLFLMLLTEKKSKRSPAHFLSSRTSTVDRVSSATKSSATKSSARI